MRRVGVSHQVGSDLCYWLVMETGHLVLKMSVKHATREDYLNAEIQEQILSFTDKLHEWLDDANFQLEAEEGF